MRRQNETSKHRGDVGRLLEPKTRQETSSGRVIWLNGSRSITFAATFQIGVSSSIENLLNGGGGVGGYFRGSEKGA